MRRYIVAACPGRCLSFDAIEQLGVNTVALDKTLSEPTARVALDGKDAELADQVAEDDRAISWAARLIVDLWNQGERDTDRLCNAVLILLNGQTIAR